MTKKNDTDRARQYIDAIVAINKRHGMGGAISQESYEQAVARSARAYRGLRSVNQEARRSA